MWLRTVQVRFTYYSHFLFVKYTLIWKYPTYKCRLVFLDVYFFLHNVSLYCSVQRGCATSVWPLTKPDSSWPNQPSLEVCHYTGACTAGRRVPKSILHWMCEGLNILHPSISSAVFLMNGHIFISLSSSWTYLSLFLEYPKAGLLHWNNWRETKTFTLLHWFPRWATESED